MFSHLWWNEAFLLNDCCKFLNISVVTLQIQKKILCSMNIVCDACAELYFDRGSFYDFTSLGKLWILLPSMLLEDLLFNYKDLSNGSLEIYWIFQLARDSKGLNVDILTSLHSKHADISMLHMPHVIPIFQELPNLEWSIVIFFPDLYLKCILHSSNDKLN
jgi:hypothetical protein